jgi:acetyltransferase-like isoleucine patch superfamily enzyme
MKIRSLLSGIYSPIGRYLNWIKTKFLYESQFESLQLGYFTSLKKVTFGKHNLIGERVFMENCDIGDFSYIGHNSVIVEASIGKFCSIASDVKIAPGKHPTSTIVSSHPVMYSNSSYWTVKIFDKDHHNPKRRVAIGNDVWIAANAIIADGISIGDGAIIAGGGVVTKDVEPYTIVGGVPARPIRKRFDDKQIEFLLQLQWWNQSLDWIKEHKDSFLDIKQFVKLNENKHI